MPDIKNVSLKDANALKRLAVELEGQIEVSLTHGGQGSLPKLVAAIAGEYIALIPPLTSMEVMNLESFIKIVIKLLPRDTWENAVETIRRLPGMDKEKIAEWMQEDLRKQLIRNYLVEKKPFVLVYDGHSYTVRYGHFQSRISLRQGKSLIYLDCWVDEWEQGQDKLLPEPSPLKHNRTFLLDNVQYDVKPSSEAEWRSQGLDSIIVQYRLLPDAAQIERYKLNAKDYNPELSLDGSLVLERECTCWFWTWQRDLIQRIPLIEILAPSECVELVKQQKERWVL